MAASRNYDPHLPVALQERAVFPASNPRSVYSKSSVSWMICLYNPCDDELE